MQIMQTAAAAFLMLAATSPAFADDVWHATRMLMPGDTLRAEDVVAHAPVRPVPDAVPASQVVIGLEVKRRLSDGRVLSQRDVGPHSAVKSNTPVNVVWKDGALSLQLAGRALEAGAVGDEIRVLNTMTSRTIRGTVVGDGMVEIRSGQ
jgi:flagella basal body P-ring formation protein FlgA